MNALLRQIHHGTKRILISTNHPLKQGCVNLRTTGRNPINPLFGLLLKTKGIKAVKIGSMVFGRQFRKVYHKLPESFQRNLSKHRIAFSFGSTSAILLSYYSYVHYDTNPLTGRKRFVAFTKDQIMILSQNDAKNLQKLYSGKFLTLENDIYKQCDEIVSRIVNSNKDLKEVREQDWKLHVVDEPNLTNAFVLPNGEIYIFTGMLKVMNNWEELAVVVGHEMSHAIMGHAREQQSYLHFGQIIVVPILAFIWFIFDDFLAFVTYSAQEFIYPLIFDLGFNLPYNRQLEEEADQVGLTLSSKACYDPRWSVLLWQKLALKDIVESENDPDDHTAQYFSTHPSSESRSIKLEADLINALEVRKQCNCPSLEGVDPVLIAKSLRECCDFTRESKRLLREIEVEENLLKNADGKLDNKQLKDIEASIAKKHGRVNTLNKQFDAKLSQPIEPIEMRKPQLKESSSFWSKMISDVAVQGKFTGTLSEKELRLQTASISCVSSKSSI